MDNLGLRRSELKKFEELLAKPHDLYVRIKVTTLEHQYIGDISERLVDGQVDVDIDAEITRVAKITFKDPTRSMHFGAGSPQEGAMYMDRMLKIVYVVMPPDRSVEYNVPLFYGPVDKVDRSGPYVVVEAVGKEALAMMDSWKGRTFRKGLEKTTVIRRVLRDFAGERRFDIPDRKARLPKNWSLKRNQVPWDRVKRIARGMGHQLFYNGRGSAVLRRWPSKTVWVFRENHVKSEPQYGFSLDGVYNAVEVIGANPKGPKKRVRVKRVAPRSHPLSPWKLGRWGVPRYIPEIIEDDSIESMSEARDVAKKALDRGLIQDVEASFDSITIPHLDPGDICRVHTGDYGTTFMLRKFSIGLTAGSGMSVGYHRRLSRRSIRGARRRRRG